MPPRLGELLIDAGLLGTEHVEQGLRAQVMWGGRLGTNLVELGFVELDDLARLLGRQQRYPAALAWHFEQADADLYRRLSFETAAKYQCLPLARRGGTPAEAKVVVATAAPIDARGLREIATELGTESAHLMPALAGELRIQYFLERVYGLPRETRYLRTRSPCRLPFETDCARDPSKRLSTSPDDRALPLVPIALDPMRPPTRERRRYVATLGTQDLDAAPPRRFARGTDAMAARRTLPNLGASLHSATRTIRTSIDREQIADLVVATIVGFLPTCLSAVLLVVHGGVSIPVTGFRRDGMLLADLAVPLDKPGLVPATIRDNQSGRAHAATLGLVDAELLETLGGMGGDLIVEPVAVAGHVLGVLAMAARTGDRVDSTPEIAQATGAAFTRLLRDVAK